MDKKNNKKSELEARRKARKARRKARKSASVSAPPTPEVTEKSDIILPTEPPQYELNSVSKSPRDPDNYKTSRRSSKSFGQAGTDKLKESGLNLTDAAILGIEPCSPLKTLRLDDSFQAVESLKINYYGPDGAPLSDWPSCPPFFRVRYLETLRGFQDLKKKPIRYVQRPRTMPVAYYPQNFEGWESLCIDPTQPLIVTEGEFKAAKACKEGFPTLGLGGVYNWRSYKNGIVWLESLDYIEWRLRNVYIVFDSDYRVNPAVSQAISEFAAELQNRGAIAHLVSLPDGEDGHKNGLDDFLVAQGNKAQSAFQQLLSEAVPLGLTRVLWSMNERYIYVDNPGVVVSLADYQKISPSGFTQHRESTTKYLEVTVVKDGHVKYNQVAGGSPWIHWPLRNRAAGLTYAPGDGLMVERPSKIQDQPLMYLNQWHGWGVEPEEGDVKPFLDLLDHLFTDADDGALEWFMCWCAYPIQNPGHKMFSSAVIHGVGHGTGKTLVGHTLAKIYGQNATEITQNDLAGNGAFNEWAENKQFVIGDDVTGSNKRHDADILKKMITQQELRINIKFVPSYTVPDVINYFFTSNHPDSFFLEDGDRRFFIHEVTVPPLPEAFYQAYMNWLKDGGASHVFNMLLNYPLEGFNPSGPAFKTQAKARMLRLGKSDLGEWVATLKENPEQLLKIGDIEYTKDLITPTELLMYYDPEGHTRVTANGFGRELSKSGFVQALNGSPLLMSNGDQKRLYIIRNRRVWEKAGRHELRAHLEND